MAWRILNITLLACEVSTVVQWFEYCGALPFFGIGMKTDIFPPKTDGSCWRVLTKHGLLEKGMANPFSILALKPHEQYENEKIYDTER